MHAALRSARARTALALGVVLVAAAGASAAVLRDDDAGAPRPAGPRTTAPSPSTGTAGPGPRAQARPVLSDGPACPALRGYTCSTLTVPLDHTDPDGRQLELRVAAGDDTDAPRGVLLFLTGGPGQPGLPSLPRIAGRLDAVLDDYRLVMLDQRGTGRNALVCPALQRQMGSTDLFVPTTAAVRDCATALGPDRRFYGTRDTVADLDLLRRALGVESWAVDGVSYGSFVAAHYAIAHPASTARMVLDSVVPHQALDPFMVVPLHATGRVLASVCEERACPGDPSADLRETLGRRDDGSDILNAITVWGIVDPAYGGVPEALHAAAAGDDSRLDQLVEGVRTGAAASARELSQGLHAATLCADGAFPWGPGTTPYQEKVAAVRREATGLTAAELYPFDRPTAAGNGILVTCELWPPTSFTGLPTPRLLPDVPTLLLGGDRDLSTPVEWLHEQAAVTPDATVVVVPGAGHSVQSRATDDRGREAVARFLLGGP